MGGSKEIDIPDIPDAPEFANDPLLGSDRNLLSQLFGGLTSGGFLDPNDPLLGFLNPLVSANPEITNLALQQAQLALQPAFDRNIQDITNIAAANNQLGTSTFTDALSGSAENLNSQFQAITTGAALSDAQRALQNQLGLFGLGLNAGNQSIGFGLQAQGQENAFNQQNFENQLEAQQLQLAAQLGQEQGGFLGGITGALGGGLGGFALGGPIGAGIGALGGGFGGGFGPQGFGGGLLNAGSGLFGLSGGNPFFNPFGSPLSQQRHVRF